MEAKTSGFPLEYHNVFFSGDYAREFQRLFGERRLPDHPTVYVCAQDRYPGSPLQADASERLFCLINAPATGDSHTFKQEEIASCTKQTLARLADCGLQLITSPQRIVTTTPNDFARRFPATGGALYGQATHGWMSAFQRPGARTRLPGLYLAGGGVHPGPGVPMVSLSGQLAAQCLVKDFASTRRSLVTATAGGISMP
jgi:1-hydroxycarotenoid 3,4-desaturase